jgi:hypothetical protein
MKQYEIEILTAMAAEKERLSSTQSKFSRGKVEDLVLDSINDDFSAEPPIGTIYLTCRSDN